MREQEQVVRAVPPMPAARVRALAGLGPIVRLQTGIPTLDSACRGGLPTRRLVIVGGAPGAGKTTLVTNLAWEWASTQAAFVVFLAVDEGPEGVLMRIAQREGFRADLVEERDAATLEGLANILDTAGLAIIDADDAYGTVEGAAELLAGFDPAFPRVLVVDSLQTVRAAGTDDAISPRERVDAVVRALRLARDRHGFLVLATCELARGAYRSRQLQETISDLAAFKESGGIEYAAQTALVLRSVADESSLVDVTVPKNRAYRRDPFRLRIDFDTTAMEEVDMPPPATQESRSTTPRSTLEEDVRAVRHFLLSHPGVRGLSALRTELRAQSIAMSNDRVGAAVAWLRNHNELEDRPEKGHPRWYLRQASNSAHDTTPADSHTESEDGDDDGHG